jgi:hypothetical protein
VIGRPVPLWVTGTTTIENAQQTLAYNQIFTALDTVTEWPATQARLEQAVKTGLASGYPAGFAALAADAAQGLRTLRGGHEKTPDSEGWYLVCRPARPSPSMELELEQLITGARVVEDLALVGKDLVELRRAEREWTDKTDLAADDSGCVVTLLALTPAEDGVLQADSGTPAAAQLPGGVRLRRRHPRHHLRRYPPLRPR